MNETLIGLETAKLAKEKGFDWNVTHAYSKAGFNQVYNPAFPENMNDNQRVVISGVYKNPPYYSAPTQSLLQKWLREKHLVHIEVTFGKDKEACWFVANSYSLVLPQDGDNDTIYKSLYRPLFKAKEFPTYEEALEAGLIETLTNIKL
jgi:hypothetical protein